MIYFSSGLIFYALYFSIDDLHYPCFTKKEPSPNSEWRPLHHTRTPNSNRYTLAPKFCMKYPFGGNTQRVLRTSPVLTGTTPEQVGVLPTHARTYTDYRCTLLWARSDERRQMPSVSLCSTGTGYRIEGFEISFSICQNHFGNSMMV